MSVHIIKKINNRIRYYRKKIRTREKIKILQRRNNVFDIDITSVWNVNPVNGVRFSQAEIYDRYSIFGTDIPLSEVNWYKDYVSGFEYPKDRFDKINISQWYNRGIDVKFPWEVSRFYFAVPLAQKYIQTGDEKYYLRFRDLVGDWLLKNKFLYGINWHCTMEVAIRSVNWIVAMIIFGKRCRQDREFYRSLVMSLQQHAKYIDAFPEIKYDGTANNHLVADYFGLLFLALSLCDHPEADEWLQTAKNGIEKCIITQVYDDGTSFEGSIPYHRLVLEMFGYAAILCRANDNDFPESYYERLFRMFEFTAAYMDHNGNAPQIGDNDSGRTIILHTSDEHDHSYLLDLGEHLFDYRFLSQCKKRNNDYVCWLPNVEKITVVEQK